MHLHFLYRADVEREAAGSLLHGAHGRQLSQLGKRATSLKWGFTFMVSEVARIWTSLSQPMSAVLNRIAWWCTECSARPLMCIYLGVLGSQCRNGALRVGVGSSSHVVVV